MYGHHHHQHPPFGGLHGHRAPFTFGRGGHRPMMMGGSPLSGLRSPFEPWMGSGGGLGMPGRFPFHMHPPMGHMRSSPFGLPRAHGTLPHRHHHHHHHGHSNWPRAQHNFFSPYYDDDDDSDDDGGYDYSPFSMPSFMGRDSSRFHRRLGYGKLSSPSRGKFLDKFFDDYDWYDEDDSDDYDGGYGAHWYSRY